MPLVLLHIAAVTPPLL